MSQALQHTNAISACNFAGECRAELGRIARWWLDLAQDPAQGGFYGEIDDDGRPNTAAEKGVVLNTRILWFFSEAALFTGEADYRRAAERAYRYLREYFFDAEYGGYYWSLRANGQLASGKKQVYAQAFAIYALCAYYQLTGEGSVLQEALDCFELIEARCVDRAGEGYLEAYTREWGEIDDVRLSEKDLNFPKTMNTHLHVLEAYTSLYQVHKGERVARALGYTIDLFDRYMIDRDSYHLRSFMDADWSDHSPAFTYGHDIECAWLLCKALSALGDAERSERLGPDILQLARTCQSEAIGSLGEVLDGRDKRSAHVHGERIWWVQAEAMVGFLVAWSVSDETAFYASAANVWNFIKTYQIDKERGEWLWHSRLDAPDGARDYKAGFWKGPYHNGRAMIEAIRLLG
ncbi:AGE family epimerase/isomerase [Gilvimarinus algae]|uniref:Cellobiose 2-epimerase n=1 Tax=Gilvimarinus algae TaxID=3058037 RepID=A0ABT8TGJ9_9GAMM|nr:AGE family epimerase/isomerase [Gilvimarinus sp. SDUM040014]MDO3383212.1 AGE family epimerase/isomerase [Gilvimarinus sp. SDUM040014]